MPFYDVTANFKGLVTTLEYDTKEEAEEAFRQDFADGHYVVNLSSVEVRESPHEKHMLSYEAGVIASRIHPDSIACELSQATTLFEAAETLHSLVSSIKGFVKEDFLLGFFNELRGDKSYGEDLIQANAKLVLGEIIS